LIVANAAFSTVLYILLIPGLGWEGAAIGTFVSEILLVITTWTTLVVRQRRSDAEWSRQSVIGDRS
jgi:O-antigen/teichoic acid export membrane protein